MLQNVFDRLDDNFKTLELSLNMNTKCKAMMFNRCRSPLLFSSNIKGYGLLRADCSVLDLGFKLSKSLELILHAA